MVRGCRGYTGLVDGVLFKRWQLMIRCVQLCVGVPITQLKY